MTEEELEAILEKMHRDRYLRLVARARHIARYERDHAERLRQAELIARDFDR